MNPELAAALARLDGSIDRLEAAASRHLDPETRRSDLETELQVMGDDRARLATDLEGAASRVAQLETASGHVALRVEAAIGAVQAALGEVPVADGPRPGSPPG